MNIPSMQLNLTWKELDPILISFFVFEQLNTSGWLSIYIQSERINSFVSPFLHQIIQLSRGLQPIRQNKKDTLPILFFLN